MACWSSARSPRPPVSIFGRPTDDWEAGEGHPWHVQIRDILRRMGGQPDWFSDSRPEGFKLWVGSLPEGTHEGNLRFVIKQGDKCQRPSSMQ